MQHWRAGSGLCWPGKHLKNAFLVMKNPQHQGQANNQGLTGTPVNPASPDSDVDQYVTGMNL